IIVLEVAIRHAGLANRGANVAPWVIVAHPTNDQGFVSELMAVKGKVERGTAQLPAISKQVPKDFSESDDGTIVEWRLHELRTSRFDAYFKLARYSATARKSASSRRLPKAGIREPCLTALGSRMKLASQSAVWSGLPPALLRSGPRLPPLPLILWQR